MSDRSNGTTNQPQTDSRANLFYLLQTLSKQAALDGNKSREESPITNEQLESYIGRNGTV